MFDDVCLLRTLLVWAHLTHVGITISTTRRHSNKFKFKSVRYRIFNMNNNKTYFIIINFQCNNLLNNKNVSIRQGLADNFHRS